MSSGRFELMRDEDTGRLYWYGGEDGWKDNTEIGVDGVLTICPEHFTVGTVLEFTEPVEALEEQAGPAASSYRLNRR